MWDKLMASLWSFWNIEVYRKMVIVIAIICASATAAVNELISAMLGKWTIGDMLMIAVALTLCIYFVCYAIKHRQEWHGKYDEKPLFEVDLW